MKQIIILIFIFFQFQALAQVKGFPGKIQASVLCKQKNSESLELELQFEKIYKVVHDQKSFDRLLDQLLIKHGVLAGKEKKIDLTCERSIEDGKKRKQLKTEKKILDDLLLIWTEAQGCPQFVVSRDLEKLKAVRKLYEK